MSQRLPVHVTLPEPGTERPWGPLRTLQEARNNILRLIPKIATTQPIVSGKTAGRRWHMVMDPSALGQILKDKLPNYPKSMVTKSILEPAIGDSLFIAEGAHWQWQRRAAAPVFSARNIANLAPYMQRAADECLDRLSTQGEADLFNEMTRTTFDVIANVTFSGGEGIDPDQVFEAIEEYIDQVAKISFLDILGVPKWVPRPARLFGPDALRQTKRIADDAVTARRANGPKKTPDLLDLLMQGEDPKTKRQMNAAELRDNILTFIVAGHETTALTLSWALYLLAFDQDVQNKMRKEVDAHVSGDTPSAKECANLTYTKQVIQETLRLYPPAAFLSRTALAADQILDREVRRNDTIMLPVYALHRNELLWTDPNAFDPDRFAPDQKIERYSYLPFGDGPRICIGAQFAILESQIILASLIKNYQFEPIEGEEPEPKMIFTLRPEGGVNLRCHRVA